MKMKGDSHYYVVLVGLYKTREISVLFSNPERERKKEIKTSSGLLLFVSHVMMIIQKIVDYSQFKVLNIE